MYSWPSISAEFAQLGAFRTGTGLQSRESGLWLDWHHGNTEESLRRLRINPSAELALWVKRINPCSYCCFWRPRSHHLPLYLAVFLQASSELHPGADTSAAKEICDEISCRTWLYLSPKKPACQSLVVPVFTDNRKRPGTEHDWGAQTESGELEKMSITGKQMNK